MSMRFRRRDSFPRPRRPGLHHRPNRTHERWCCPTNEAALETAERHYSVIEI